MTYAKQQGTKESDRVRRQANTYFKRSADRAPKGLRPVILTLILAIAVIGLVPSSALARTTRLYEGSFGSLTGGRTGRLAVDQSNGDIYVASIGDQDKVTRFDSTGAPKNFTAGPNAGTNTLTGVSGFADFAIDNSGGPLNGSIYMVSSSSGAGGSVKVFASNGESLGAITGAGTPDGPFADFRLQAITIDQSNGNVYINDDVSSRIWRYAPNLPNGAINDTDYTVTGISSPAGGIGNMAVGFDGLYVTRGPAPNTLEEGGFVRRLPTSAFAPGVPQVNSSAIESEGSPLRAGALTVDPKNGDLYAVGRNRVSVLNSNGALLYKFGASHYFGEGSEGIAVKSAESGSASKVYVSDTHESAGGEVTVFGPLTNAIVRTHPAIAAFGKDGSGSTSFSGDLVSLGFDRAARKLYALDRGLPGIYGFDAAAVPVFTPLAAFAPLPSAATGAFAGLAVDNTALSSAGNLYFASNSTNLLYGFDSTGTSLGGSFPVDPATSPGSPEGSPVDLRSAAVDSVGNIWVINRATKRILGYSSAGAYLGSVDTSAQGLPDWVAFDGSNDMYVAIGFGQRGIWKYTAPGYAAATQVVPLPRNEEPGGIAIDSSTGNLYVGLGLRIEEYDSTGNFLDEFAIGIPRFPHGLTVDSVNHYVYATDYQSQSNQIHAFGPGVILPDLALEPPSNLTDTVATLRGSVGSQTVALSDCHFEYVKESVFLTSGFSDLSSGGSVPCGSVSTDLEDHALNVPVSGLSANTTYSLRLSAANANGSVETPAETFTTLGPARIETIGSPLRSTTTVQLSGRVNPSSSATSFHFEYGSQGPCNSNLCTATDPVPAGSGNVFELAATQVSGLSPNTTYHYRIVADNGTPGSPAFGEDMSVTTRASDAPLSHGHFPGPPGSDRAYEQVTLPDTGGNPVNNGQAFSDDGNRAIYITSGGNPSSPTGGFLSEFFAERVETAEHTGSWKNIAIMPPREELAGSNFLSPSGPSDLSSFAIINFAVAATQRNLWRMSPDAPAMQLFEPVPPQEEDGWYVGSDDSTRVVARLKGGVLDPAYPAASALGNLYDISSGTPKLASLLPGNVVSTCDENGKAVNGLEESQGLSTRNWISPDGKFLFFQSCTGLYMREFEAEQTKLLSGPPLSGGQCRAVLVKSTADAAFFWTKTRLAAEDTNPTNCTEGYANGDIYRYEIDSGALKCVTCVVAGLNADVYPGFVESASVAPDTRNVPDEIAVADNGSRVYFQSSNRLTEGAPSLPPNGGSVYRVNVSSGDVRWIAGPGVRAGDGTGAGTSITPDGSVIVFRSQDPSLNPLGDGADNAGKFQYYRYDDRDRSLICVSCPPDGSPAVRDVPPGMLSTGGQIGANTTPLADDGSFVFKTTEALVGADQNTAGAGQDARGGTDLYEWREGRLLLITDGLTNWPSSEPPALNGVSRSGRDVFFTAPIQYTQDALDAYNRLYDARIGGGFEFPPPPKPCPLEVCQGTPKGAPEEPPAGTGNFSGPGNAVSAKGKKKAKKKQSRKKNHKKQRQHKANNNRRAGR